MLLYHVSYTANIIRIYHECEGGIENSIPGITVWHHEACRVMTHGDHEWRMFYPSLTRIMDYFPCLPLNTAFYVLKMHTEVPELCLDAT